MRYLLNPRFLLRGWYKAPTGLYDTKYKAALFFACEGRLNDIPGRLTEIGGWDLCAGGVT